MSTRPARAIERVIRISRKAVDVDVIAIAAKLDLPLRRLVARLAQALQLADHEGIPVAAVRNDVIHHIRRGDHAALQTEFAQRVALQLQLPQPLPMAGSIEGVPSGRMPRTVAKGAALNPKSQESFRQFGAQASQPEQSSDDETS